MHERICDQQACGIRHQVSGINWLDLTGKDKKKDDEFVKETLSCKEMRSDKRIE